MIVYHLFLIYLFFPMFQVEEFLSNKADSMKTMRSSANKILTTIAANIEWVNQHAVPLIDWFQSNGF